MKLVQYDREKCDDDVFSCDGKHNKCGDWLAAGKRSASVDGSRSDCFVLLVANSMKQIFVPSGISYVLTMSINLERHMSLIRIITSLFSFYLDSFPLYNLSTGKFHKKIQDSALIWTTSVEFNQPTAGGGKMSWFLFKIVFKIVWISCWFRK